MDACKRLLNESKFAEICDTEMPGYSIETVSNLVSSIILYRDPNEEYKCMAHVTLDSDGSLITLYIQQSANAARFILDYEIEPYTYTYNVKRDDEFLNDIKPFTYSVTECVPHEVSLNNAERLPVCVVYDGKYNIPSVLKIRDNEMEYTVARKLQNGEPITMLKSARH